MILQHCPNAAVTVSAIAVITYKTQYLMYLAPSVCFSAVVSETDL